MPIRARMSTGFYECGNEPSGSLIGEEFMPN